MKKLTNMLICYN